MRPLIGVTSYFVDSSEMGIERTRGLKGQDMLMSTMDYSRSIEKVGAIPVNIPVILSDEYIDGIISKIDGLVLTGGGDIHPKFYNQSVKVGFGSNEKYRDEFEMKLLDKAIEKDIPVMGICRGFQLLNIYFGGTLIQDISKYHNTYIEHTGLKLPKYEKIHKVHLVMDSIMKDIFREEMIGVNSFHHQIIDKVGDELDVIATSEDGIAEAIVHKEMKHVFAVQWHPEMMAEVHAEQYGLFWYFIEKINANKKST
ncbi:MAG: gamma-glutamyl-gamma-aminobutyrate hydrolase family protein [Clostridiales bacterium]|nr:gamma-glutamyl-gamma-aminobutyrate hydrolase family protein [Clostridiales bacterium]